MTAGKKASRIEARVSDDTKADLATRCHKLGISESEYIDRLVQVSLYGVGHVLSVEQQLLSQVCGLSDVSPDGKSAPASVFHG